MGSLIKNWYAEQKQLSPSDIYHVTLMPCYDKKLEASRDDFYNPNIDAKDVDCVLTPGMLKITFKFDYLFVFNLPNFHCSGNGKSFSKRANTFIRSRIAATRSVTFR